MAPTSRKDSFAPTLLIMRTPTCLRDALSHCSTSLSISKKSTEQPFSACLNQRLMRFVSLLPVVFTDRTQRLTPKQKTVQNSGTVADGHPKNSLSAGMTSSAFRKCILVSAASQRFAASNGAADRCGD